MSTRNLTVASLSGRENAGGSPLTAGIRGWTSHGGIESDSDTGVEGGTQAGLR